MPLLCHFDHFGDNIFKILTDVHVQHHQNKISQQFKDISIFGHLFNFLYRFVCHLEHFGDSLFKHLDSYFVISIFKIGSVPILRQFQCNFNF